MDPRTRCGLEVRKEEKTQRKNYIDIKGKENRRNKGRKEADKINEVHSGLYETNK